MTTKRGVNLGCGTITLPRGDKPGQHSPIPDAAYFDPDTQWDNVDRHAAPGVSHLENLWALPWNLETSAYDLAIVSHVAEHIPHDIVWNGRDWGTYRLEGAPQSIKDSIAFYGAAIIPPGSHPEHQGGWYAWFSELWRIMKPGGVAYILVPHAFSNGAVAEPTHTRLCLPATFGYFNPSDDFVTPLKQKWAFEYDKIIFQPHEYGYGMVKAEMSGFPGEEGLLQVQSNRFINVMFGFMMTMTAIKDDAQNQSNA